MAFLLANSVSILLIFFCVIAAMRLVYGLTSIKPSYLVKNSNSTAVFGSPDAANISAASAKSPTSDRPKALYLSS